ncbi:MAG: conjugal transfer protein TraX [Lachnospiraceae bacterium]|nr:conjugal transfer protein TraX [Lachnospiraceae bacterium]
MEGQIQAASGAKLRVLNRDIIKYIAMFTMLLNHIAHIFLVKGTPLYEVLEDIGYFTAPAMCYFLAEGYVCTRSRFKYGFRLILFAVISQIPFQLAFGYQSLNMIYTLLCCFLILAVVENVESPLLKMGLAMLLTLATVCGDWGVAAPIFTILFYNGRGDRKQTIRAFAVCYVIFVILNVQNYMNGEPGNWTAYAVFHALLSGLGILAAGIAIVFFYNGKRMAFGKRFSQWFFYLFYPVHLLILYLIKTGVEHR